MIDSLFVDTTNIANPIVNHIVEIGSQNVRHTFFDLATLPFYLIGFFTFAITLIDDWLNPKKCFKSNLYYVQDFFYTLLSIAVGISACYAFEVSQSVTWIVTILMGLCGSSIIRKIREKREDIGCKVVDKITDTIDNTKTTKGDS